MCAFTRRLRLGALAFSEGDLVEKHIVKGTPRLQGGKWESKVRVKSREGFRYGPANHQGVAIKVILFLGL